jgi:hypothetical protein
VTSGHHAIKAEMALFDPEQTSNWISDALGNRIVTNHLLPAAQDSAAGDTETLPS